MMITNGKIASAMLVAVAGVALLSSCNGGAQEAQSAPPVSPTVQQGVVQRVGEGGNVEVYKVCDNGRIIYFTGGDNGRGGIAVQPALTSEGCPRH